MPTSRSRPRATEPPQSPSATRLIRPLIPVVVVAVLAVIVIALPASLIQYALPNRIGLEEFSGTLWHGSADKVTVDGRPAGALEWRLHPAALLTLTLAVDLHWVNVGFLADTQAEVDRHGLTAHDLKGGGPIEDLNSLGIAAGWRGTSRIHLDELRLAFTAGSVSLLSARGDGEVAHLSSQSLANGADLGGYTLKVADTAEIADTGGPLELKATVHFAAPEHTGTLSGTVKARADAPPALRSQIDTLAQMHAPDAAGRIPIDLEFNY
jgi:Type II secretion system (T2SS), protein N